MALKWHKKAQTFFDSLGGPIKWSVFLIGFVFTVLIVGYVVANFADEALDLNMLPDGAENPIYKFAHDYPRIVDWFPLVAFIVTLIGSVIAARKTPISRGYVALVLFLSAAFGVLFMFVTNWIYMLINIDAFATVASKLTIIPIIASYNGYMSFLYFILVCIAMFTGKDE